jgi:hypothetical protein
MGWRELEEYQENARLAEWLGSAGFAVASQPGGEPAAVTTAHKKRTLWMLIQGAPIAVP